MKRKLGMFLLDHPKFTKAVGLGAGALVMWSLMDIAGCLGGYQQLKELKRNLYLVKEREESSEEES